MNYKRRSKYSIITTLLLLLYCIYFFNTTKGIEIGVAVTKDINTLCETDIYRGKNG